jgi:hypothetical protein
MALETTKAPQAFYRAYRASGGRVRSEPYPSKKKPLEGF